MHPLLFFLGVGLAGGQIAAVFLFGLHASVLDIATVSLLIGSVFMLKKRVVPPNWAPVLGFAGASILSILYHSSTVPVFWSAIAGLYIVRFLVYASLYWVSSNTIFTSEQIVSTLIGSGVLTAILGLVQFFLYPDLRNLYYLGWDPHFNRLFSTLLDPNFTGIILTFTAFSCIGLITIRKNINAGIALLLTISALVLTYSRSSYVAFGAGLLLWGFLTGRKFIAGIIFSVSVLAILLVPHVGEGQNLLRTTSSLARIDTVSFAVSTFMRHPFIGAGMNTLLFDNQTGGVSIGQTIPSLTGSGIDTSVLYAAASAGIIGVAALIWLISHCVQIGLIGIHNTGPIKEASSLYLAGITSLLIHSVFVNSLFYPWVLVWLFLTLGVMERWVTADT